MSIAGKKANLRNLAAGDMTKFQEGPSMNHGYESCTLAGKGSLGEFGGGALLPFHLVMAFTQGKSSSQLIYLEFITLSLIRSKTVY